MKRQSELIEERKKVYGLQEMWKEDEDFGKANFMEGYIQALHFAIGDNDSISKWKKYSELPE